MRLAITTTIPVRSGYLWFPLEVPQASMREVFDALQADGLLYGERIETAHVENGRRQITAMVPQIIGKNAVATIAPLRFEYDAAEPSEE